MTPGLLTAPTPDYRFSRWPDLTRRERAHAVWLALRAGWRDIDIPAATSFDTDAGVVVVEHRPGDPTSAATWSMVTREADETLARIETTFGGEARRKAEEVIDG